MHCSKHADAQTAPFKCHGNVFENVKCTVCMSVGGGGGGGGTGPGFVCWFVCFLDSTKSNRLFVNGFLFHPFHSFILPLPHKTHLHFATNFKKS